MQEAVLAVTLGALTWITWQLRVRQLRRAGRIGEFGASPNKLAALGMNVVLAVNLAVSAWWSLAFLRGRRPFGAVARWQARYLPVIGAWALVVALGFPVLFGFG